MKTMNKYNSDKLAYIYITFGF